MGPSEQVQPVKWSFRKRRRTRWTPWQRLIGSLAVAVLAALLLLG
jgi:hypothetical protein